MGEQTAKLLLKNKQATLTIAGFLFATVLCASTIIFLFNETQLKNESFKIPVEVSGFKEKIKIELYTEKDYNLIEVDRIDSKFETCALFDEGENIEVYVLTPIGIALFYGDITASRDYTLLLTNSTQGVQTNYLRV